MIENPLVSIIIPVYNGSDYLIEAIDSALAQTYQNIEIIVVNDGSNDDGKTDSVALSYGDKIKYIKKANGGVSSALNLGIANMTGEYFSWLSHDDKYTEAKIENQVKLLKEYGQEKAIALCEGRFIDENSQPLYSRKQRLKISHLDWEKAIVDLFEHGTYNGCAFLVPKKCFDECGVFDERLRFAQDTLMWSKFFFSRYTIVHDDRIGVLSRVHKNQQTQKSRHLLKHDSILIAEYIIPRIVECNNSKALYFFAKRNAKLGNGEVVQMCVDCGMFTWIKRLLLRLYAMYGRIRPAIRKVYYRVFRGVEIA